MAFPLSVGVGRRVPSLIQVVVNHGDTTDQPTDPKFEPYKGKIRKPGTGCVTMINDHLYEGRFSPRVNGKRIAKNIYAKTREECEEKLAEMIERVKKDIAKAKEKAEG